MSEKKLRGIPRRLRAVKKWPERLLSCIPGNVWNANEPYWNWKIPVHHSLVLGRYATPATRRACAQGLIDASAHLLARKPAEIRSARVTCAICLPDMFASEVCVYLDEDYFSAQVHEGENVFGERKFIRDRKLSSEWALHVPTGISELGIIVKNLDEDGRSFEYECWYFGEIVR
ncbi:DUF3916 domain-containing protein [Burkholderia vietnamiensis]|uniref:DUF3916 domain-containing protein n=1 Tax=Burkholderia vietnamiensis TaxID=60552 RepID=UPI001E2B6DDF|nr:DUF3916 domain-containing protein [Burkholderia vietnamiensis]